MAKDDEKVKNALEKIKGKKKAPEKPAEQPTEEKEEVPEETSDDPQGEDNEEIINVLQNAGVYRREMLLRANVQIDLLREMGETLKRIEEDQKNLIEFLKN